VKEEIIVCRLDQLDIPINVRVENESVWLNRQELATLFGRDVKAMGTHTNNVF
jgi:propanediol utilization protein